MEKSDIEIWKNIKEYEGLYQASNLGRIKSLPRNTAHERIMKQREDKGGYLFLSLTKNGIPKTFKCHRLVAETFISNPHNLPEVNHKKEFEKYNNTVENLEWCTRKYNANYGTASNRTHKKQMKKVYQYDMCGKLLEQFPSLAVACNKDYDFSNIAKCCRGIYKSAYGFVWSYTKLIKYKSLVTERK